MGSGQSRDTCVLKQDTCFVLRMIRKAIGPMRCAMLENNAVHLSKTEGVRLGVPGLISSSALPHLLNKYTMIRKKVSNFKM